MSLAPVKRIQVAIAILHDLQGRILITQRAPHLSAGGFWEFPGGKLEINETPAAALIRETKEEVNLDVIRYKFITRIVAQRMENTLILHVFDVQAYLGKAVKMEEQTDLLWVNPNSLDQYTFPSANRPILDWVIATYKATVN